VKNSRKTKSHNTQNMKLSVYADPQHTGFTEGLCYLQSVLRCHDARVCNSVYVREAGTAFSAPICRVLAARYGLDSLGIESRWGRDFSAPVQTGCRAYAASYIMDTGSYPGIKRPGCDVDHPPHLAQRLKEE